ncbi:16048_t:CDS:2, partial [Gigaspora margarita]
MTEESNLYSNSSLTYSEEDTLINTEQGQLINQQIWEYYITSSNIGSCSASCYHCPKSWSCGRPGEMETHLANICLGVPKNIKEYWQESLSIKDYSKISQTGVFIANEIETIIKTIGINEFAGIVMDCGSNVRVACQIINQMYPHILNIHCTAHSLNLIATDL